MLFHPSLLCCCYRVRFTSRQWNEETVCCSIKIVVISKIEKHVTEKPHELYSAFSVYKNGVKLFDVDRKSPSNILHCLSGLRTLAMLHIMLGHRFGWTRGFPNVNSSIYAVGGKWTKTILSALVTVSPIAVDSFFVIGGLLLARSILHQMEKSVCLNFLL